MSLPKKSLLYAAILLTVYSLYALSLKSPSYVVQHQWQNNSIKAEKFLYDDHSKNVIIGSSLAARMDLQKTKDYYNLSLSGQSALDGLKTLTRKKELPDRVFIEMNTALVPENSNFTGSLLNPVLYNLRMINPAFRDGMQPLAILSRMISSGVRKVSNEIKRNFKTEKPKKKSSKITSGSQLFDELLAEKIKDYNTKPGSEEIEQAFNALTESVDFLQKQKVEVIFFELPVNPALCDLPKAQIIRKRFIKQFPPSKFRYIPQPDCNEYRTSDGIHLNEAEADRYTFYFLNYADKM